MTTQQRFSLQDMSHMEAARMVLERAASENRSIQSITEEIGVSSGSVYNKIKAAWAEMLEQQVAQAVGYRELLTQRILALMSKLDDIVADPEHPNWKDATIAYQKYIDKLVQMWGLNSLGKTGESENAPVAIQINFDNSVTELAHRPNPTPADVIQLVGSVGDDDEKPSAG